MKSISFCTLGCRVNQYESRALAESFAANGYTVVPFGEKCDVCIVNTCAVTAESERKSAQMIRRAIKTAKEVRVCGCYAERRGDIPDADQVVGCRNKGALQSFEVVETTEKGYELLNIGKVSSKMLPTISEARAFVKIQDGCNGKCTYCIIPKLRGRTRSRPPLEIIAEVKRLTADGCKEIVLTGIETAAYNYMPLWSLIKEVAAIDGIERLRLGSLDPLVLSDEFIKTAIETKKLMPHFHLSLQSGNTRILKLMGRPYTAEEAKAKISALKEALPRVMLSADIICSFPTETVEELKETVEYLKDIGFVHIHAFSYSKRPDTPAAAMDGQVPENEKKVRMAYFLEECREMSDSILNGKIGTRVKILVEKATAIAADGHTEDFCEATVESTGLYSQGEIVECVVSDVRDNKLICKPV